MIPPRLITLSEHTHLLLATDQAVTPVRTGSLPHARVGTNTSLRRAPSAPTISRACSPRCIVHTKSPSLLSDIRETRFVVRRQSSSSDTRTDESIFRSSIFRSSIYRSSPRSDHDLTQGSPWCSAALMNLSPSGSALCWHRDNIEGLALSS